ncbi:MAG TPA: hypothetical protein VLG67_02070 [Candidatus Saccharimonadales bacterium]|nr:hypothetical protein [Candidatus Saccharimonadales bacterium]
MNLQKKLLTGIIIVIVFFGLILMFFKAFPVTASNMILQAKGYVPYQPLEANLVVFRPNITLEKLRSTSPTGKNGYIAKTPTTVIIIFMNNSDSDYNSVEIKIQNETNTQNVLSYHGHGKYDFSPKGITTPTELDYYYGPLKKGELRLAEYDFIAKEPGTSTIKATVIADKKRVVETNTEEIKAISE